jgi:hypothetical protein
MGEFPVDLLSGLFVSSCHSLKENGDLLNTETYMYRSQTNTVKPIRDRLRQEEQFPRYLLHGSGKNHRRKLVGCKALRFVCHVRVSFRSLCLTMSQELAYGFKASALRDEMRSKRVPQIVDPPAFEFGKLADLRPRKFHIG